jgi:hypothetical protein
MFKPLLYVPFSVLYGFFLVKVANLWYSQCPTSEKNKKTLLLLTVGGIIGLVLYKVLQNEDSSVYNPTLSTGLGLGGIFVMLYALTTYWNYINEQNKTIIFGGILAAFIWYSYKLNSENIDEYDNTLDDLDELDQLDLDDLDELDDIDEIDRLNDELDEESSDDSSSG